jgi:hypothetical protein
MLYAFVDTIRRSEGVDVVQNCVAVIPEWGVGVVGCLGRRFIFLTGSSLSYNGSIVMPSSQLLYLTLPAFELYDDGWSETTLERCYDSQV